MLQPHTGKEVDILVKRLHDELVWTFEPLTDAGREWINENVPEEHRMLPTTYRDRVPTGGIVVDEKFVRPMLMEMGSCSWMSAMSPDFRSDLKFIFSCIFSGCGAERARAGRVLPDLHRAHRERFPAPGRVAARVQGVGRRLVGVRLARRNEFAQDLPLSRFPQQALPVARQLEIRDRHGGRRAGPAPSAASATFVRCAMRRRSVCAKPTRMWAISQPSMDS